MTKYRSYLVLLIGMLVVLFVGPNGDFPLNDDWRYAYMVRSLAEGQGFALNSEIAPTILLQAIWGYLFVLLGGYFSFSLLRISTLVLAIVALWGLHKTLRTYLPGQAVWKGVALLAFNPVFFLLSFSFMTDVPFLSLCVFSIYAYLQFLNTGKSKYRWLGLVFALMALWIRQPGMLLIFAFEGSWLWINRKKPQSWGYSVGFIMLALLNYFLIDGWVKPILGLEAHYIKIESEYVWKVFAQPGEFFFDLSTRFLMAVFYMGFFFLPLIYPIFRQFFEKLSKPKSFFVLIATINLLIAIGGWFWLGRIFPYGGNIFYNWGLGPMLLYDTKELGLLPVDQLLQIVLFLIGLLAQLNGSLLLIILVKYLMKWREDPQNLFMALLLVVYFGAMSVFSFFDRHLLLIFVLLIIWTYKMKLWVFSTHRWSYGLIFSLFAVFSIAGTKDYLNWNKTVHQARQEFLDMGIGSKDIDAGLANNGLNGVQAEEATYHFSFRELEKMKVEEEYDYFSWLWLKNKKIYVVRLY